MRRPCDRHELARNLLLLQRGDHSATVVDRHQLFLVAVDAVLAAVEIATQMVLSGIWYALCSFTMESSPSQRRELCRAQRESQPPGISRRTRPRRRIPARSP